MNSVCYLEPSIVDVQSRPDTRNVAIDKVGVKNVRYPLTVLDKHNGFQNTVGSINMYVNLPRRFKGTHMSRFIEILNEFHGNFDIRNLSKILDTIRKKLDAESAHVEIAFPYFIRKLSPVTRSPGLMEYGCRVIGSIDQHNGYDLIVEVIVPITTVCPCSKEISAYGAHNQRGLVRLAVRYEKFMWIEDLIAIVESCASCDVYSVLKRVDEKYVTEKAYENAKFVEDVVRDIALQMQNNPNITWFAVDVENFESIHNHSAYAYIERTKKRCE
ncbi:MAG: GTP cyclohydrolase FolE2 [Thermodesulforhabdaceae bacterium]